MRILVVSQYFWPENFKINDLVLGLKERGHEVFVLTGKPNYHSGSFEEGYSFFKISKELWHGVKVYRSPLVPRGNGKSLRLVLNYFSFAFLASLKVFGIREKPDAIFVFQTSPVTVGIPAVVAKWRFKAPIFFWVQDLWPQSVSAAGNISNKTIIGWIDSLTKWIYKHCAKILIQSQGFRGFLLNQGVESSKIVFFPNWTENFYRPLLAGSKYSEYFSDEHLNIIFAGNIGVAQDFDTLLKAAAIVKNTNERVRWVIIGNGRMRTSVVQKLEEMGLEDVFKLIGAFPADQMPEFFAHADALLVSLKSDPIFSITIPSKLQSYMACAKPILTSLDGEGSRIVAEAEAGMVSAAGNPIVLAENVLRFAELPEASKNAMGENALRYYKAHFERDKLIDRLTALLNQESLTDSRREKTV